MVSSVLVLGGPWPRKSWAWGEATVVVGTALISIIEYLLNGLYSFVEQIRCSVP